MLATPAAERYNVRTIQRKGVTNLILAVDVGNTNIVLGGYEADALVFSTRIATDRSLEADQYALEFRGLFSLYGILPMHVEGAILSSVVPQLTAKVASALETAAGVSPLLLTQRLNTGVEIHIDRPAELGSDLLAGAVGAAGYALPAIVLDMGTATKIVGVDANGAVLGCSISPGVFISLNALTGTASQLGGIAIQAPQCAIGRNTTESMQSGVVFAAADMLDGMIDRFAAEMGQPAVILATGGAAACIVPACRHSIRLAPTLVLEWLLALYRRNTGAAGQKTIL